MLRLWNNVIVRQKTVIVICSAAILGLIVCWMHFGNNRPSVNSNFTEDAFLSKLMKLKKHPDFSELSVLENKDGSAFISSYNALPSTVTVYYVWCRKQYFEFRHFLSVKSVLQNLQPNHVILYYRHYPHIDSRLYNTWLGELQQDFPFFEVLEAPKESCINEKPSISFIYQLTNERRGIYMGENSILTGPLPDKHNQPLFSVDKSSEEIDLLIIYDKLSCKPNVTVIANQSTLLDCTRVSELDNDTDIPLCFVLDNYLYPKHIWHMENAFGRFARKLFYGSYELPVPKPSYDELIPNIGHMTWFGGGQMDFLFFLGVLSLLHVARVDTVYIHGDQPPSGDYWSLLTNNPRVVHVPNYGVHMIYGQKVKTFSHRSDVLRAELLYRYGGIYMDTDAVFVRPFDLEIRGYDAVASYDWTDMLHPFPEVINLGVTIGKKGAQYWRLFQESMKWFLDEDLFWNGVRRPYQILERHPESILIDPHLQVICFSFKCHATWWKNYHNESIHHGNKHLDWLNDTYAIHWTHPTPPEFQDFSHLEKSHGMFAEIGKYIVSRSGLTQNLTRMIADAKLSTRPI